ncbi:heterokaryon incompatibility protein-domain-containing protein [Ampelomyces quisqualis]|uniref:Heterokaryon incompatibility protein-domain-containing protein n=1 Tax=Ampelomyces quisqualis TaxID=50730 RepID=A0A6A5QA52_AMPQU|nr:heterokaryon incompatibility protein-domain-containing protein [Ampelomyces quisqualis]
MTRLSKSFRDGVRIALSLDLRYLWIDSLCILQDSKDDWAQEAEMMSEIYRYGFINIGATGASHGDEGCFWRRDLRAVLPTECLVRWSNSSENARRYQLVSDTDIWAEKFIGEPLNQRAWVLQERILSPRMLHFGHEQLFWECRELVACETFPRGLPPSLQQNRLLDIKTLDLSDEPLDSCWPVEYESSSINIRTTWLGSAWSYLTEPFQPITVQNLTVMSPVRRMSIYQHWNALVELYSLGALTFSSDKLVALSGLANNISIDERDARGDRYLAGLWQSSLPAHLLWVAEKYKRKGRYEELPMVPGRHGQYVAPSWSWASIDGKISFTLCKRDYHPRDFLVKLEGAKVTWSEQNAKFGQVLSGFLNLSGPLVSAKWDPAISNMSTSPRTARITHLFPPSLDSTSAVSVLPNAATGDEIFFDTETDKVPDPIILLPIIRPIGRGPREVETVSGLVLRRASGAQGDFERVGVFITMRERVCKILKNMPVETVTIR